MLKFIPSKDDIITKLRIENNDCKALNFELKNKLTKYKRAFEIIKKHSKVDYIENTNINDLGKDYNLFICEINSIEDKEEYELLEELMKGEETKRI